MKPSIIRNVLLMCIIVMCYASVVYAGNSWYETAESSAADYGFPSTQIIPGSSSSGDEGEAFLFDNASLVSAQRNIAEPSDSRVCLTQQEAYKSRSEIITLAPICEVDPKVVPPSAPDKNN